MEIRRITAQKHLLERFFEELAALGKDNGYSRIGARMLELLRHLRTVEGPPVWAVTSHATLNLVPGDDYRLPVLVRIACDGEWFHIEYRMPPEGAPWPEAYVTGRTPDVGRAGEMMLFGLREALRATEFKPESVTG